MCVGRKGRKWDVHIRDYLLLGDEERQVKAIESSRGLGYMMLKNDPYRTLSFRC